MQIELKNELVYQFENFTTIEKILEINGVDWRYTISGKGDKALLVILANISGHLLALPLVEKFFATHKILALSVPPMEDFSQTAEGLKAILDYETITFCDVLGHSNGGVYLQNLISRYPAYIGKIIFSHSLTSMNKNDAYTINASELKVYKITKKLLKVFPISLLIMGLQKTFLTKLHFKSNQADTEILVELCKKDMKRLTKKNFLTMMCCMEDFLYHYIFTTEPYVQKGKDVLIIDSESDKIANTMQRQEMLRLCPNAQEYHFATGGHVTMLEHTEEYFTVLENFLNS